jgi:hypothetical protein
MACTARKWLCLLYATRRLPDAAQIRDRRIPSIVIHTSHPGQVWQGSPGTGMRRFRGGMESRVLARTMKKARSSSETGLETSKTDRGLMSQVNPQVYGMDSDGSKCSAVRISRP